MDDKQRRYDKLYLDIASRIAQMSFAERLKVGAIAVKNNNILAFGFNGTPAGFDNCCEYRDYYEDGEYILRTKPEVIHAEANLVAKAAREGLSLKGSTIYLTHSSCVNCAILLVQAGIEREVYLEEYRNTEGLSILKQSNIKVEKFLCV